MSHNTLNVVLKTPEKGWPQAKDFPEICIDGQNDHLNEAIQSINKKRYLFLTGKEGRGKTTLCRHIGSKYAAQEWLVFVIEASSFNDKDRNFINDADKYTQKKCLFLIEDLHSLNDPTDICNFINSTMNASFIITARSIEEDIFENTFIDVQSYYIYDVDPSIEDVKSIIALRTGQLFNSLMIEKWLAEQISNNLKRLDKFITAWEANPATPLYEVDEEKVYSYTFREIFAPFGEEMQEILFQMSAIYKYGVEIDGKFFNGRRALHDKFPGIVFEHEGYYRLSHSTDADFYFRSYLYKYNEYLQPTEEQDILAKYLICKPRNYNQFLRMLYDVNKELHSKLLSSKEVIVSLKEQILAEKDIVSISGAFLAVSKAGLIPSGIDLDELFWRPLISSLKQVPDGVSNLSNILNGAGITQFYFFIKNIKPKFRDHLLKDINIFSLLKRLRPPSYIAEYANLRTMSAQLECGPAIKRFLSENELNVNDALVEQALHTHILNLALICKSFLRDESKINLLFEMIHTKDPSFISNALTTHKISHIYALLSISAKAREIAFTLGPCFWASKIQKENISSICFVFLTRHFEDNTSFMTKFSQQLQFWIKDFVKGPHNSTHINKIINTYSKYIPDLFIGKLTESDIKMSWEQTGLSRNITRMVNLIYKKEVTGMPVDYKYAVDYIKALPKVLPDKIASTYKNRGAKPLKIFGKLLHCCHIIDPDSASKIADIVLDAIVLENTFDDETLLELSLLINNARLCKATTLDVFLSRLTENKQFREKIEEISPINSTMPYYLYNFYVCAQTKKYLSILVKKILELSFKEVFAEADNKTVSRLLFNLLQIDKEMTTTWIDTDKTLWIAKIVSCTDLKDAFYLSWIYFIVRKNDLNDFFEITSKPLLDRKEQIEIEDLPYFGLLDYFGVYYNAKKVAKTEASTLARKLAKHSTPPFLYFGLKMIKIHFGSIFEQTTIEISKIINTRSDTNFNTVLTEFDFEDSSEIFQPILNSKIDSP